MKTKLGSLSYVKSLLVNYNNAMKNGENTKELEYKIGKAYYAWCGKNASVGEINLVLLRS